MNERHDPDAGTANLFESDRNLRALLKRGGAWLGANDERTLSAFGAWVGTEVEAQADYTNRFATPRLDTEDVDGRPLTVVRHNPLYEAAHREVYRRGIVGLNYGPAAKPYTLTFAMGYLLAQSDISIHCPVTLTGAVAYVLDRYAPPAIKEAYLPALVRMDGEARTGGTWVTEKHGGSDVGGTTTRAAATNRGFALTGLKWFASNVDGGIALTTARPDGAPDGTEGLGLYIVPATLADGTPNRYRIRRLKEKLGTRGLATGEIELDGASAVEVAPPPQGFKMMMAALGFSRIHNAMASAGIQRRALHEAHAYAAARSAFGHRLTDFPMIQDQLTTMLVRQEASTALAFAAARAFDASQTDASADTWMRVATALAKYLTADWAIASASQAIEVLGGNGYTEEYVTARLLRDAQVLTVWEGPPNIQALELLRLLGGRYAGFAAFETEIRRICAADHQALGGAVRVVNGALEECARAVSMIAKRPEDGPRLARRLMDLMARALGAALLIDEAMRDLAGGDARKALVARAFANQELVRGDSFSPGPSEGERLFEPLLDYEAIAPSALDPERGPHASEKRARK